ncbi:MAG: hypothetical protein OXT09_31110 [Myxococcales bacterium]|nr:hypothetical protein [Myxococcales bacterium]
MRPANGRSASHLVNSVLPEVPIRQWVMTLPWQVRAVVGSPSGV